MLNTKPALDLSGRIPELDGLRGIAIGLVLIRHYIGEALVVPPATTLSYLLVPIRLTWSGVDLFFVLSGFLIGGILLDARESSNYFRVFYTRRFFRIVPLYFAFLLIALGLYAAKIFDAPSHSASLESLPPASYFFFLQNFWMAASASFGVSGLAVTWSLAVEEQFYLTLPPLVRFLSKRGLAIALASGIVLAPVSRIALHWLAPHHFLSWYTLMPCRADALLLGVLGAFLLRDQEWSARLQKNRHILLLLILPLIAGVGVLTLRFPDVFGFGMLTFGYSWLAVFYLCVLLCALLYGESWFASCLRTGWLTWLGSIAYGTYLFHRIVRDVLGLFLHVGPSGTSVLRQLENSVLALALTLALCRLSWAFFEKPLIQIGHRAKYQFGVSDLPTAAQSIPVEGD